MGEVATVEWLKTFLAEAEIAQNFIEFENFTLAGDIYVKGQQLELKSVRMHQWDKYGRMVPPKHLKKYVPAGALVVWAAVDLDEGHVILKGWNPAHEVQSQGIPTKTKCDNIWLKDEEAMRPMSELKTMLEQ